MPGTILLVEDHFAVRRSLTRYLERKGYVVDAHASGDGAVKSIEGCLRYGLALIDRELDNVDEWSQWLVDGDDVMSVSKRVNPRVPIISFSAYDDRAPLADGHLRKPCDMDTLLRTVKRHIP